MIPLIGLGTYLLKGEEGTRTVRYALELGYRHIDTAHVYENHLAIHKAIKDFPREQLYITSKMLLEQGSAFDTCDLALKELGIDYLDLYLIHWPDHAFPMRKTGEEMMELKAKGKIKEWGVSNFNEHHLEDLKLPVFANQVEFHPYLYQKKLLDYCLAHQIKLVAYRPFGKGELLKDPLFGDIGKKYNKTGSQVILRWITQKHIPVIPKASSMKHLKENLHIFDFELSDEDLATIDNLNRNQRFCKLR